MRIRILGDLFLLNLLYGGWFLWGFVSWEGSIYIKLLVNPGKWVSKSALVDYLPNQVGTKLGNRSKCIPYWESPSFL